MEHLIALQQCTIHDFESMWENQFSDNWEYENPEYYLYKRDTYYEGMLCHSKLLAQNEACYLSAHPQLFTIRDAKDMTQTEIYFMHWMHDVMREAPHFFCLATQGQYLHSFLQMLFEDYLRYGAHDFFERLKMHDQTFRNELHVFLDVPFMHEPLSDKDWNDFIPDCINDELVKHHQLSYQYQPYEAFPSGERYYEQHRHDDMVLSQPTNEITINI